MRREFAFRTEYANDETCERPAPDDSAAPVNYHPGATRLGVVAASRHDRNESWSAKAARSTLEDRDVPWAGSAGEARQEGRQRSISKNVNISYKIPM